MGSNLFRYTLYEGNVVVRVRRPAAPNPAVNATRFADRMAQAKQDVIAGVRDLQSPGPSQALCEPDPCTADLFSVHGGPRTVWMATDGQELVMAIAPNEEAFWHWVDEDALFASDRKDYGPARQLDITLVTEADVGLIDPPELLVHDLAWLTGQRFRELVQGGLESALKGFQARTVEAEEVWAIERSMLYAAFERDLAEGDFRSAAWRCWDRALEDPDGCLQRIARVEQAATDHEELVSPFVAALDACRQAKGCSVFVNGRPDNPLWTAVRAGLEDHED